jgi:hypothetical protein
MTRPLLAAVQKSVQEKFASFLRRALSDMPIEVMIQIWQPSSSVFLSRLRLRDAD